MSNPPKTPPHSDIDGVHEDEERNTDVAAALDQAGGDLERARKENVGRPPYSDEKSRDDRTG